MAASSIGNPGDPITRAPATARSIASSRLREGGWNRTAVASGGACAQVRLRPVAQVGRFAHVTVVEADHEVTALHERAQEAVRPADQLAAEAGDEDKGRVGWVAERLVRKGQPVRLHALDAHPA